MDHLGKDLNGKIFPLGFSLMMIKYIESPFKCIVLYIVAKEFK